MALPDGSIGYTTGDHGADFLRDTTDATLRHTSPPIGDPRSSNHRRPLSANHPRRAFTKDLVQRAEASGCRALCVTVDSPTFGARNREDRAKGELPARELPNLQGKDYLDPALTWKISTGCADSRKRQ